MSSMSTNIDDIPDPVLHNSVDSKGLDHDLSRSELTRDSIESETRDQSRNDIKSIDLQQKEMSSNISSIISTDKQTSEQKDMIHNILSENNILVFFIIIIASLPQTSEFIYKFVPLRFHNSIIVNIIKAILLFVIYIVIIKYIL